MKVMIIPEDQELDQYIVRPVVEAMFADLQKPAQVRVLPEPRLRGAGDALDEALLRQIIADNPMIDLFLLMIDRDCDRQGNEAAARARETTFADKLIACVAIQEIEVWLLALYRDHLATSFKDVREHCDPKEAFAEPWLKKLGSQGPGHGRKQAMRELAGKWRSLCAVCTELKELQDRISAFVQGRGS